MKSATPTPQPLRVNLTYDELLLTSGALAETLEEQRQPYTRSDLRRLVRLHARLLDLCGLEPEYALTPDAVVIAPHPDTVVCPLPRQRHRLKPDVESATQCVAAATKYPVLVSHVA